MLKAHQAIIDLEKNVLRIQGREVRFLAEHELPENARLLDNARIDETAEANSSSNTMHRPSSAQRFPGSGQTLGQQPSQSAGSTQGSSSSSSRFPESSINTLIGLGVTREEAIRALEASQGNVDVAASFLF